MNARPTPPARAATRAVPAEQFRLVCGPMPDGGTGILERHVEWPWSFPRGYRREGRTGPLTVLPQTAGAALLPGDDWGHALRLEPGARVRLVSAGAMLVHATPRAQPDAPPGAVRWRIEVGAGAELQFVPDPYVLSPGARIRQTLDLTVREGASAVVFDGFCRRGPGDGSTAEDTGGWWSSCLTLRDAAGRVVLTDSQRADEGQLAALRRMPGRPAAFGSVVLVGPAAQRARWAGLWPEGAVAMAQCHAASGALRGGAGQVLRIAAESGGALDQAFATIARALGAGG
ncbi:urease accessory protein UreD [Frigidibacter sp. MR17.24]|uniref:urease accessory protein UreD n=1 Tax=Frigidibacter sp. MR17.24 TaxID=3127345 RepID=UPI003012DDEC